VSPAIAAWLLRIPVVTHESDLHPGLATKIIARVATVVCVSWENTAGLFANKRVVFTGNPLRNIIKNGSVKRGLNWLHFRERLPIVTVFGGSLGASSINSAVWEMYGEHELPFNLVHQCGRGNLKEVQGRKDNYREYEFLHEEIGDVIAASDLLISRAGAGALYEIGALRRPAVLIPLPRSKSRGEQIRNALYFEENGAAKVIDDGKLDGKILYEMILRLLDDRQNLRNMGEIAGSLCKSDAHSAVVDILQGMLEKSQRDR
jgi:UDP-N-acetylglucosamine--N-acetylmuramyl-(pentapeptide) pyrophosphoryl-undecaprenol N-acetylglucosamine transferase